MEKIFFFILFLFFIVGCQETITPTIPSEKLKPEVGEIMIEKKVLMIIAPKNFRDEEFLEPKKVFEDNEFNVKVASKGVKEAKGMLGAKVKVDLDINEVEVEDYDAIVFIGGSGASIYYDDKTALNIAREGFEKRKIIGAICIAPGTLAKAGILKGKKATIWDSGNREFISKLEDGGAKYTGKNVEQDGDIITANGPGAATNFGLAVAEAVVNQ